MDFSWLSDPFYQEYLIEGLINTLWLLLVSAIAGLTLAVGMAMAGTAFVAVALLQMSMDAAAAEGAKVHVVSGCVHT